MKFEQHHNSKTDTKVAMTQKLQQSIQVLQYNAEELTEFIDNKSLENPAGSYSALFSNLFKARKILAKRWTI